MGKKKLLAAVITLSVFFSANCLSYAQELNEPVTETPVTEYSTVSLVSANLSKHGNKAKLSMVIREKIALSSVKGTFKLINGAGDEITTVNGSFSKSGATYSYAHSFSMPKKATYHVRYVVKTYKSGNQKETLRGNSNKVRRD